MPLTINGNDISTDACAASEGECRRIRYGATSYRRNIRRSVRYLHIAAHTSFNIAPAGRTVDGVTNPNDEPITPCDTSTTPCLAPAPDGNRQRNKLPSSGRINSHDEPPI